jgi:hypothetical protein
MPDPLSGGRHRSPAPATRSARRIQELAADGASLHTIAAALNREGLRTDKQVRWTARTVALVLSALDPPPEAPKP